MYYWGCYEGVLCVLSGFCGGVLLQCIIGVYFAVYYRGAYGVFSGRVLYRIVEWCNYSLVMGGHVDYVCSGWDYLAAECIIYSLSNIVVPWYYHSLGIIIALVLS